MIIRITNRERMKLYRRHRKKIKIRGNIRKLGIFRLTVYKSLNHIYAQVFVSDGSKVLVSASSIDKEVSSFILMKNIKGKRNIAFVVGEFLAKRAVAFGVVKVAFDASGFCYHGRIKMLADSARMFGLVF